MSVHVFVWVRLWIGYGCHVDVMLTIDHFIEAGKKVSFSAVFQEVLFKLIEKFSYTGIPPIGSRNKMSRLTSNVHLQWTPARVDA